MIKLIDGSLPSLQLAGSFVGAKIYANHLAYSTKYPFSLFWVQLCDNSVTAVINKFENTIFITAGDNADLSELREFCDIIGYCSIQASADLLCKMGFEKINEYVVLSYENKTSTANKIDIPTPNLKAVYDTLFFEAKDTLLKPEWEGWYADISHRIRHNVAAAFLDDKATLVFSHITDDSAIISGVSVLPEKRKNGLGTKLLAKSINSVFRRNIFACTDLKTADFYLKNGFNIIEKLGIHTAREE